MRLAYNSQILSKFAENYWKTMRKSVLYGWVTLMLCASACTHHYQVTSITRSRTMVDGRYDAAVAANSEVATFMDSFKAQVDQDMSPVVGRTADYLDVYRPESPMSNLLPDILVWAGQFYNEQPDFGVYNTGGIRAALPAGDITVGDVVDVAPFENKVCFLTLSGDKVMELMRQIVGRGGEGISREVRIVAKADKEGKNMTLQSATIKGEPIDPQRSYRIATIDYVAHGNDKMTAFKAGTDINMPGREEDLNREVIMRYFREMAAQGKAVEATVDGRFTIVTED